MMNIDKKIKNILGDKKKGKGMLNMKMPKMGTGMLNMKMPKMGMGMFKTGMPGASPKMQNQWKMFSPIQKNQ